MVKTSFLIFFSVSAVLFGGAALVADVPQTAIACERDDLKIDCKGKGTIEIIDANYGRTASGICPGANNMNTKCDNQKKSLEVVYNSCSFKSSCTVKAANSVFGDPCVGTYKYLEVKYTCKPKVLRACEGSDLNIDCNGEGTIEVVSANYGRTSSEFCPGAQDSNIKCDNELESFDIVHKSCSSKSSCTVKASNSVFGDPCVGTYKYLEVQYTCKPFVTLACEGDNLKIDCNGLGFIEIVYANYGRTMSCICPGSNDSNTECNNEKSSLEIVRNRCSNQPSCNVKACNTIFGDPCVGTYKFLEVQHICKHQSQVARACEGNDLNMDCKGKGTIEVVNANYGRTMSGVCPGANDINTKCDNKKKSLDIVQNSCSAKSSCIVKAANAVFGDPCYGTYKYLEVEYNCKPQVARACEGNDLIIDCNGKGTVEVVYANYGRTLAGVCPGVNDINTKCINPEKSIDIVQNTCSAKSSCIIKASNTVFGDPCVGTYKYLEVQYNCKPQTVRACEGKDLKIDCEGKGVIDVINANYGRIVSGVCPGANDMNTKCENQKKSLEVVYNSCSSKSTCVVKAENAVFGDPCYGTYKYLDVQFTCRPQVARACEGKELRIDCNEDETIEVINANYGRNLVGICPGSNDMNTKCNHHKKSYDVVQSSCSTKSSCTVKAENAVFGDPCVGTYKYLEVQYNCKPKPQVARACEGNDLKIDCNGKGTINVVNANYGRTLAGVCPGANDSNTKCDNQKKSIEIVQNNCSSKSSCIVKAANSLFGDPCYGTYKYLEVQYTCK
ncbi:uncharacterized protein LOC100205717 isoform X1 [Hydra vulgaris]|nr:uncharacterized protein LOC100205717 [Hydra vulgaris]